jgi:hypothetical protein
MDCDGMLVKQAGRNKASNPTAKVFVYRNIVKVCLSFPPLHHPLTQLSPTCSLARWPLIDKALPWYTQVRKLLADQSYWGWFIPYAGCRTASGEYVCKNNVTGEVDASSNLYHDQVQ